MLVALLRLRVVMVVPSPLVKLVPLPDEPMRHVKRFTVVRFVGTVAVHTILKVL